MDKGRITLNIGGKKRTLKFNMRAVEAFGEIKSGGTSGVTASTGMVYAGLIGHCYEQQIEPDFTFSEIANWVEDMFLSGNTEDLMKVDECFSESRAFSFLTGKKKKPSKKATKKT